MAYGEKMWLTTAISEKRDPKDVQKLFEECWGKTTSMGRIGEIRRKLVLTSKQPGGARPYLSDERMYKIHKEFGDENGMDIIRVASLARKTPQRLVQRCEEMGLSYYNVPRNIGERGKAYLDPDTI